MDREKIDKVIREKTDFFDSSEEMDEFLPKEKDFATSNANAENEYFSSWESINVPENVLECLHLLNSDCLTMYFRCQPPIL